MSDRFSLAGVEVVRRVLEALSDRDAAGLLALSHPDVELHPGSARLTGRDDAYDGHDGLRAYLADVTRRWQELRWAPDAFAERGETVVASGRLYAWGVGQVIDSPAAWVWRVRGGLVLGGWLHDSRRAALASAGLGPDALLAPPPRG